MLNCCLGYAVNIEIIYGIIFFLVAGFEISTTNYVFCQDKEPYISQRVEKLVKVGVVNALVAFGKSDSENSNELLSRYLELFTNTNTVTV